MPQYLIDDPSELAPVTVPTQEDPRTLESWVGAIRKIANRQRVADDERADAEARTTAVTCPKFFVDQFVTAGAHTWNRPTLPLGERLLGCWIIMVSGGSGGGGGTSARGGIGGNSGIQQEHFIEGDSIPAIFLINVGTGGSGGAANAVGAAGSQTTVSGGDINLIAAGGPATTVASGVPATPLLYSISRAFAGGRGAPLGASNSSEPGQNGGGGIAGFIKPNFSTTQAAGGGGAGGFIVGDYIATPGGTHQGWPGCGYGAGGGGGEGGSSPGAGIAGAHGYVGIVYMVERTDPTLGIGELLANHRGLVLANDQTTVGTVVVRGNGSFTAVTSGGMTLSTSTWGGGRKTYNLAGSATLARGFRADALAAGKQNGNFEFTFAMACIPRSTSGRGWFNFCDPSLTLKAVNIDPDTTIRLIDSDGTTAHRDLTITADVALDQKRILIYTRRLVTTGVWEDVVYWQDANGSGQVAHAYDSSPTVVFGQFSIFHRSIGGSNPNSAEIDVGAFSIWDSAATNEQMAAIAEALKNQYPVS